jgi:hypothetical protein
VGLALGYARVREAVGDLPEAHRSPELSNNIDNDVVNVRPRHIGEYGASVLTVGAAMKEGFAREEAFRERGL